MHAYPVNHQHGKSQRTDSEDTDGLVIASQVIGTKIHKLLNIQLSTVRAIRKRRKKYGRVENVPGRGCKYILSPHAVTDVSGR